jgi:hypothetical protein
MIKQVSSLNCEILEVARIQILWLKINKQCLILDKDLVCGVVYIHPEGTSNADVELFDQLENDIVLFIYQLDCYLCISGDFNAHIGTI